MEKENPSSISKAGAAKTPDLNSSFTTPGSRKDRPSDVEGRFRAWAGRAKEYGKMAAQRERVLAGGSPGLEPLKGQAAVLQVLVQVGLRIADIGVGPHLIALLQLGGLAQLLGTRLPLRLEGQPPVRR